MGLSKETLIKRETGWLILFFSLGMISLWHTIVAEGTWGPTYQNLFVVTLIGIFLALFFEKVFEFQNINPENIKLQIVVGLAVGIALVGKNLGLFSILSPLSVPQFSTATAALGILGFESLAHIFLMSVVVSELEESFRCSLLRPSIYEWLSNKEILTIVLMVFGTLLWLLIPPVRLLGLGLMGAGIINAFTGGSLEKYFKSSLVRWGIAIIVSALFFAILHLKAYGVTGAVTEAMMFSAFLYACIAGLINTYFKSSIPGKIAHTMNNAVLSCVQLAVPVYFAFVVTIVHAFLLFIIAEGGVIKWQFRR